MNAVAALLADPFRRPGTRFVADVAPGAWLRPVELHDGTQAIAVSEPPLLILRDGTVLPVAP